MNNNASFFKINFKKECRIFLCYRSTTAILARNFYDYVKNINISLLDSRFFGEVYYSDYISCGNYLNYEELKKVIDKVEYFIIFLDKNFTNGFFSDGVINKNCVTAHEIKYMLERKKDTNIIIVNVDGYNFKDEIEKAENVDEHFDVEILKTEKEIRSAIEKRLELVTKNIACLLDAGTELDKIKKAEKLTRGNNINNFDIRQGSEQSFFERLLGSIEPKDVPETFYYFGKYPQRIIPDVERNKLLNDGIINCEKDGWISYHYMYNGIEKDYMRYKDFENKESKIRGVHFSKYRPCLVSGLPYGYQQNNKYAKNKYYFFDYEPIKWRLIKENKYYMFLASADVLDSQPFYGKPVLSDAQKVNNFENSTIKEWLNNSFYDVTFTEEEKDMLVSFDNGDGKVSLLPESDVIMHLTSMKRNKIEPTDYALSQGVYVFNGNCDWLLRDSAPDTNIDIRFICGNKFNEVREDFAIYTNGGVIPYIIIDKRKVNYVDNNKKAFRIVRKY